MWGTGLHIPRSNACNVRGHKKVWGWAGTERSDLALKKESFVISSFRRNVNEIFCLLVAYIGS
jgi:hypothetical protein